MADRSRGSLKLSAQRLSKNKSETKCKRSVKAGKRARFGRHIVCQSIVSASPMMPGSDSLGLMLLPSGDCCRSVVASWSPKLGHYKRCKCISKTNLVY